MTTGICIAAAFLLGTVYGIVIRGVLQNDNADLRD